MCLALKPINKNFLHPKNCFVSNNSKNIFAYLLYFLKRGCVVLFLNPGDILSHGMGILNLLL